MTNVDEEDEVIYEGKGKAPIEPIAGRGESAKQPEQRKKASTTDTEAEVKTSVGAVKKAGAVLGKFRQKAGSRDGDCSMQ